MNRIYSRHYTSVNTLWQILWQSVSKLISIFMQQCNQMYCSVVIAQPVIINDMSICLFTLLILICAWGKVPQLWRMSDPAAGTLEMQITGIKANERRLCQYRVRASPGEARTSHNSFSLFHFSSLSLSLSRDWQGPQKGGRKKDFSKH